MLTSIVAHGGEISAQHDLWSSWNLDPLVLGGIAAVAIAHRRGAVGHPRITTVRRRRCFASALAIVGVALVSPLDALAGELASAHMVQHVLLVVVAAPLLAVSAPVAAVVAGLPRTGRAAMARVRRRTAGIRRAVAPREPVIAWAVHVAVLWFWHASGPYDLALERPLLHAVEHTTFLLTALWFWSTAVRPDATHRWSHGHAALSVFAMAFQGVLLAALLTFATAPWYRAYLTTAPSWGLDPLTDQQLAGAIMWVPAGLVHVGAGIVLVMVWLRRSDGVGTIGAAEWTPDGPLPSWSALGADEDHGPGEVHRDHEVALDADAR